MRTGLGPQLVIEASCSADASTATFTVAVPWAAMLPTSIWDSWLVMGIRDWPCAQSWISVRETKVYSAFAATVNVPSPVATLDVFCKVSCR